MKKTLLMIGGMAGAVMAVILLWQQLGGAIPATRSYVKHTISPIKEKALDLSEQSAHHGVEIYKTKLRGLLIMQPPKDQAQRTIWQEIIDDTKNQQKYYEDREIELHKFKR